MAKFFYRMQNILNIKYKLEEQAKLEFSQAQNRYRQEEEKLRKLRRRKASYLEEMRQKEGDRLNVRELERLNDAMYILDDKIREQKEQVFRAMADMDQARVKLNEVMQERKTHEKLREHQFETFLQEINTEEQKEIDQLVSYRHSVPKEGE